METKITIGNKTWIVPSAAINGLIAWLNVNAVDASLRQEEVREVNTQRSASDDTRQLLMEDV
jgi:hypothetical protein